MLNSVFNQTVNAYTSTSGTSFIQAHTTADANNFSLLRARGTSTSLAAVQTGDELAEFVVGGHDGQTGPAGYEPAWGFTTTVIDTPSSNVMPVRTDFVINTAASTLSTYHSISDDLVFRIIELGVIDGVTDLFISAGTDGNIELSPDGTGDVFLTSDTVRIGDLNTAATLTTNGTGNLTLSTNSGTNSGTITIAQGVNGTIALTPNGDGQAHLVSAVTQYGTGNTTAVLTTNGTGSLLLNTNGSSPSSGSITINQGANANIDITPNGTGDVNLNADTVRVGDINLAATITTNGAGNLTLSTNNGTNSGTISITQGANNNITLTPNGNGRVSLVTDTMILGDGNAAATITTNGTGSLTLNTNNNTNSGTIVINQGVNGNIVLTPNATGDVHVDADTLRVGDSAAAATITTNGTGNLTLSTNSGTNSGTIVINNNTNGNIELTPNGTGGTVVKNLEYQEFVHALGTTSGTIAPNAANGNVQTITLNGNLTINGFTSPVSGQTITLIITTGGTGRTLTSTMLFAGASKTLSTTSTVDILTMSYIGTTYYATLSKGYA